MLRLFLSLCLSDWVVLCKCWWEDSDDGAERLEKRRKGKQTQSNHKQQQQHDKKTWLIIKLFWCCCYCHAEVLQDWKAVPQMRIKKMKLTWRNVRNVWSSFCRWSTHTHSIQRFGDDENWNCAEVEDFQLLLLNTAQDVSAVWGGSGLRWNVKLEVIVRKHTHTYTRRQLELKNKKKKIEVFILPMLLFLLKWSSPPKWSEVKCLPPPLQVHRFL